MSFWFHGLCVSGKVAIPYTDLITPVGWVSLLQMTVLSRSTIIVKSKYLLAFFVLSLFFYFSVGVRVFVIGLNEISSFFFCNIFSCVSCYCNFILTWHRNYPRCLSLIPNFETSQSTFTAPQVIIKHRKSLSRCFIWHILQSWFIRYQRYFLAYSLKGIFAA